MPIDPPPPVRHLCPDLAAVARILRRHVPVGHPDRAAGLRALKAVRDGIHGLRDMAAYYQRRAR